MKSLLGSLLAASFASRAGRGSGFPSPISALFEGGLEGLPSLNDLLSSAGLDSEEGCPGCSGCSPAGLRKVLTNERDAAAKEHDTITEITRGHELDGLNCVIETVVNLDSLNPKMLEAVGNAALRSEMKNSPEAELVRMIQDFQKRAKPLIDQMVSEAKSEVTAVKLQRQLDAEKKETEARQAREAEAERQRLARLESQRAAAAAETARLEEELAKSSGATKALPEPVGSN